jgi:hypothetical protein
MNLEEINQLKEIMNEEKLLDTCEMEVKLSFYRHLEVATLLAW